VTGKGLSHGEGEPRADYDDAICALLSVYHQQGLFQDPAGYRRLLQRHIRRGLREIRTGWRESHDFHELLYRERFAGGQVGPKDQPGLREALEVALEEIGVSGEIIEQGLGRPDD